MADFEVGNVTTYPHQTLITFKNTGKEDGLRSIVFSDVNNNGKLDEGDKKLSLYYKPVSGEQCSGRKVRPSQMCDDPVDCEYYNCLTQVTKKDIGGFGARVSRLIKTAREHRKSLPQELAKAKPVKQYCTTRDTDGSCTVFKAKFKPPLSVNTRTRVSSYTGPRCTHHRHGYKPTTKIDPADCLEASAWFITNWGEKQIEAHITVGRGDDLTCNCVAQYFNLVNREEVPDVIIFPSGVGRHYMRGHADLDL